MGITEWLGLGLVIVGIILSLVGAAILIQESLKPRTQADVGTIIFEIAKKSPLLAAGILCIWLGLSMMGVSVPPFTSPSSTSTPTPS